LIDPKTKKAIAAYGWLQESEEGSSWYWVSIGHREPEYFSSKEQAEQFYKDSIAPLKAHLRTRGLRGYGNNRRNNHALKAAAR